MIWAVILAAGKSERMGTAKLLLPWKRKTIIETVVKDALESGADKVLVVLGANADKIKKKINEYSVKTVVNRNYPRGMLSSVQTAFQALPSDVRAAIIMLGDQPAASSSIINKLIKAFRTSGKGIVLPVLRTKRGHPVLIDLKYRDEVIDLPAEIGLRELIHRHPEDILEVPVRTRSIFQDIDRPEDYRQAVKPKE